MFWSRHPWGMPSPNSTSQPALRSATTLIRTPLNRYIPFSHLPHWLNHGTWLGRSGRASTAVAASLSTGCGAGPGRNAARYNRACRSARYAGSDTRPCICWYVSARL